MKRIGLRSVHNFYQELRQSDPELGREMDAALGEMVTRESTAGRGRSFTQETVVLTKGRPVLDIKGGEAVIDISEVESQIWKQRLTESSCLVAPNIPAVGRIELLNHPRGVDWLGTGWLFRDDVVVTNRHVAEVFGESRGARFLFRPGFDSTPMRVNIDFLDEFDCDSNREFPLFEIVHIEPDTGPDLAFLRIKPIDGQQLPKPVTLSATTAQEGDQVAVIGYPARDPYFPDPELMDRVFQHRYDKKRLAPGLITGKESQRIFHDCSTLGGNSGGEVISLKTGHAVALHFAGTLFTKNHAIPVDVVAERLDDVLRPGPAPRDVPGRGSAEVLPRQSAVLAPSGPRALEATIPIKIRVEIGDVSGAVSAIAAGAAPPSVEVETGDDDLVKTEEARPEDYRDRDGYNPKFLGPGFGVPLPVLTKNLDDVVTFTYDGERRDVLDYQHFSVMMSVSRRLCRFSACNIDGKNSKRMRRTGWQIDPRIPRSAQILRECYGNLPKFSRGHMTRREDPAWGSDSEAALGNSDSMHVTNAVPQVQSFNAGIWLSLEDYALQNARQDDMRISVFTGPFLAANDPVRYGVKIPTSFWKVIVFIHDETGKLCATGYTMSQRSLVPAEEKVFGNHENSQRPIAEIERRAGISFGRLAELDPMRDEEESVPVPLTHTSQIRFFRK
jgi:endonuclease G